MRLGCYTLDLYCDCKNPKHEFQEFPHQFTGNTFAECHRQARALGWRRVKQSTVDYMGNESDFTDKCPKCLGRK